MFGVTIFPCSKFLITFGGRVDMVVVKFISLYCVGVFVALAVVTPQAKHLVAAFWTICKNDRKIQCVKIALAQNESKIITAEQHRKSPNASGVLFLPRQAGGDTK